MAEERKFVPKSKKPSPWDNVDLDKPTNVAPTLHEPDYAHREIIAAPKQRGRKKAEHKTSVLLKWPDSLASALDYFVAAETLRGKKNTRSRITEDAMRRFLKSTEYAKADESNPIKEFLEI